jgi:hypothetical protein
LKNQMKMRKMSKFPLRQFNGFLTLIKSRCSQFIRLKNKVQITKFFKQIKDTAKDEKD